MRKSDVLRLLLEMLDELQNDEVCPLSRPKTLREITPLFVAGGMLRAAIEKRLEHEAILDSMVER